VQDCLGYIRRLNIPVDEISISGLDIDDGADATAPSSVFLESLICSPIALAGTIVIICFLFCPHAQSESICLIVGTAYCAALFQINCAEEDGRNLRGKVQIAIRVSKLYEQNSVRAIMQEFGAVVTVTALNPDFGPKRKPPPMLPS